MSSLSREEEAEARHRSALMHPQRLGAPGCVCDMDAARAATPAPLDVDVLAEALRQSFAPAGTLTDWPLAAKGIATRYAALLAERETQGWSGEPRTAAGRALTHAFKDEQWQARILAIEQEARAQLLAELRERVAALHRPGRSDVNYKAVLAILDEAKGAGE